MPSNTYLLLGFIPIVNFYLLYLLVLEDNQGSNGFGPDPKEGENSPFARPNA